MFKAFYPCNIHLLLVLFKFITMIELKRHNFEFTRGVNQKSSLTNLKINIFKFKKCIRRLAGVLI
jgi:hypothetical protein